jgi:hypothetical protein
MKYFSHDLASREDDKCFEIIDTHGMAGYGFWWATLEELYKAEDSGFQIEATPVWIKRFSRDLNITDSRTITRYFDTFADLGLINKQMWQEHIIYSDGVMKRADSYMLQKARNAKNKRDQRERDKQIKLKVTDDIEQVSTESSVINEKCHHVTLSYPDPYSEPESKTDPYSESKLKENTNTPESEKKVFVDNFANDFQARQKTKADVKTMLEDTDFLVSDVQKHLDRTSNFKESKSEICDAKEWVRKAEKDNLRYEQAKDRYQAYLSKAKSGNSSDDQSYGLRPEWEKVIESGDVYSLLANLNASSNKYKERREYILRYHNDN